jgi:hypothetical protein
MDEWLRSGNYLPEPLRDFHDQKRIFKIVGEMVNRRKQREREGNMPDYLLQDLPNWVSASIYVIDFFLWFMAMRGYTLQRSRQRFEFVNLGDDISAFERREMEAFKLMVEAEREHQP